MPLPPFDFAKNLYAAQYAYIGTIFSFTEPDSFEQKLLEFYKRPPDFTDRNDRLSYCQILLILAFGQMYSVNQWMSHDGPPGFEYFQQALELLPDIHEQGSVVFVEVLSLVGYFFQNLNLRDVAFVYVSNGSDDFVFSLTDLDRCCTQNGYISRPTSRSARSESGRSSSRT